MMDSQQVTVELPLPLFRFLARLAEQTHQPLEKLVAQSVAGNLPPSVDNAPEDMQADLLALQWLPIEELERIAHEQVDKKQQERHLHLLEKGSLPAEEQRELAELRRQADLLMLRKAYAWAVLRWRGHPIKIMKAANLNEQELLLKVAIDLYTEGRLTVEQASELAQLDRIAFQQALASRGISINYDISDFQEDLQTLNKLNLS